MTKAQLNAAVRTFAKDLEAGKIDPYTETAKERFNTLHNADKSFKSFTAQSIIIMIVINRSYHFMNPHYFGPAKY